jgi:hypothetical protein
VKTVKVAGFLLILSALAAAGCDFFKSSGPEGGVSPFISDLRISRTSVPCGRDFVISFQYQDAQNDIEFMRVSFRHEDGFGFEREVLWQQGGGFFTGEEELTDEELEALEELFPGSLDLGEPGVARYTYHFECDVNLPTGNYTVVVQLIDDNGHESNTRTDTINLTSN